jgi:positive regulator of sigma E activity
MTAPKSRVAAITMIVLIMTVFGLVVGTLLGLSSQYLSSPVRSAIITASVTVMAVLLARRYRDALRQGK